MIEKVKRVIASKDRKQTWRKDYKSKEFQEANEVNQFLFGNTLEQKEGCECVEILFFNLQNRYKQEHVITMENKQFVLRKDAVIMNHAFSKPLTHASSDEDMVKLLQISKVFQKHFDRLPSNWEAIVDGKEKLSSAPATPAANTTDKTAKPNIGKTIAEMTTFAKNNNIDLGEATKSAEIKSAIEAELAQRAEAADSGNPVDTRTEEEKSADERFHNRVEGLKADGFEHDVEAQTFTKGDKVLRTIEDIYAPTDEEFETLVTGK